MIRAYNTIVQSFYFTCIPPSVTQGFTGQFVEIWNLSRVFQIIDDRNESNVNLQAPLYESAILSYDCAHSSPHSLRETDE